MYTFLDMGMHYEVDFTERNVWYLLKIVIYHVHFDDIITNEDALLICTMKNIVTLQKITWYKYATHFII